ncbi:MAG: glycosyltransferase family 39 protein [Anaerolineae bacterium]|nr:glycosyltransferase family 39 protein [Anaerolineae bacterium]
MTVDPRAERRLLALILSLFVLLGFSYALLTPVFEASDELWHYPMVRHLADGNPLPVQVFDPALAGPWNQEASQPPLYYTLAAALTFWIDTSDMAQVRWLNPHVDNGVITADGNINLAIHDPAADPWAGTLLAVRVIRLFSVLLGAATVYLTYRIAVEIAPGRPDVALPAAALNAFLPMFLFISGAVNNDNLAVPLASLALLLMIRIVTRRRGGYFPVRWTEWAAVGVVLGLAALTKEGTLGLFPLAFGTAVVAAWQRLEADGRRPTADGGRPTADGRRLEADGRRPTADSGRRSAVGGRRSAVGSRRSLVDGRRSAVGGRRSLVGGRRSLVGGRRSLVGGRPSAVGGRQSAVGGRQSAVRSFLLALVLVAAPAAAIAGWWYARNIALYGDWLGWSAFIAVLGQRATPASLAQLWGERRGFMMSFWGLFGGVNVPMPLWIYTVLNGFLVLCVVGFLVYLLRLARGEWRAWRAGHGTVRQRLLWAVERHFGLIVIGLFAAAVVYGLVQWATTTWSSQGRLVFTALAALSVLMALGWAALLDLLLDLRGLLRPLRSGVLLAPAVFLFLVAAAAPWLWIRPAYIPPAYPGPLATTAAVTFGDAVRLAGYEVQSGPNPLRPGDSVRVRLEWEALQPMTRDWSVFVHLNDPVLGRPIAQRDMFPGQGLLATRLLSPGQRLVNDYVLTLPSTAVAPAELELVVGLYDFATGERLPAAGADAVTLAAVPLQPRDGALPNPTSLFVEHGLELVGFAVEPRRVAAGGAVAVTTYWRPSAPLPADFTFFAQIVGADTTRYAAIDTPPPTPTSRWTPGEVYEVRLPLALDPATPPDAYPLIIGLYTRTADGGFDRLQQVTPDGRLTDDFLSLTRVRVDAP